MSLFKTENGFHAVADGVFTVMGDCREHLKCIEDASVDCIITDPPYFLDNLGDDWDMEKLKSRIALSKTMPSAPAGARFDPEQGKRLQSFTYEVSKEIFRILKPGGFYLSFSMGRLYHRMAVGIEDAGFEIRDMYIWNHNNLAKARAFSQDRVIDRMEIGDDEKKALKKDIGGRKTPQLRSTSEAIVMAQKPKEGTYVENWRKYRVGLADVTQSLDGSFPGTVMTVDKPSYVERNGCKHLTVKPVKLIEHLIRLFTVEGAVVCDPFMGSGTTGVACVNTGRQFVGIELNEDYYDYAVKRIINTEKT